MTARPALFPASDIQSYICDLLDAPDCGLTHHTLFNITVAIRITPCVDLRRLERAFHRLQQRHDVLRTRFRRDTDGWKVQILDKPRAKMCLHKLHEMSDHDQIQALLPLTQERYNLTSAPLLRLDLLRFGAAGDIALFQISHTISDGYGAIVAYEDLSKLLWNLPILHKPMSFRDYSALNHSQNKSQPQQRRAYWENLLLPVAETPNFGRKAKGLPEIPDTESSRTGAGYTLKLGAETSNNLLAEVQNSATTVFARLSAAFQQTMQQYCDAEDLYFFSLIGRHDARLANFAGMHVSHLTNRCSREFGRTMSAQTRAMHKQIQSNIAHAPYRGIGPNGDLLRKIRDRGGNARQFRIHMTQSEARKAAGNGRRAAGNKPDNLIFGRYRFQELQLPSQAALLNELTILDKRTPDGIELTFVRDTGALGEQEVADLAALYLENLQRTD